ncbi:MAG: hypothetical protein R3C54_13590 [Parvularculaceae bacterium]
MDNATAASAPTDCRLVLAALPGIYALYADGTFPVSAFDVGITGSDGLVGTIGGLSSCRRARTAISRSTCRSAKV